MKDQIHLSVSRDELEEIIAVMTYAVESDFYGDPKKEPWNDASRAAFDSAYDKMRAVGARS